MRAPNRQTLERAYTEWQKASEKLAEIRSPESLYSAVDEARQLQVAEGLLQKYIELSQRFTATLN